MPEAIRAAAWRDPSSGKVWEGDTHAHCYTEAGIDVCELTELAAGNLACGEGFVTTEGRFVDRVEAMRIAKASQQYDYRGSFRQRATYLLAEEVYHAYA